ncbi:MAG: NAD(P)/FAD-dependent oxidoreductase [Endomicrobium sp.]|jgi:all-trans-retinol 13,14-reductase|nr:NAD(P)/FAD-dependent oxidoreductase [Endomicrobium sp.]
MKYDAIVLGSGISGLTSALLLGKKGKKVAIFEQAPLIAPLLAGFDRQGVHFDTGFHYSGALGKNEVGGFMFKQLGLSVPVELCRQDGYDNMRLLTSGRNFKMPFIRENVEQRLCRYFPKETEGVKKYLDLTQKTIDGVPFLNFHKKSFKNEEFFNFISDKTTLADVLNNCFKDEELKSILSFSSLLYGTPPDKISFFLHCCCSAIMIESVWKIEGGVSVLIDAFKKALLDNGVELFTNKKAVKIEAEKTGLKTVIFEDGSYYSCDICVSSIHPKEFVKIAPNETYRNKNRERMFNMRETDGFFILYGLLDKPVEDEGVNNTAFVKAQDFANNHKDFMYINFTPQNAKAQSPISVCAVLSVDSSEKSWNVSQKDYDAKKELITAEIKKKIETLYPKLAKNIKYVDSATPATFKRYVNYYGSYGIMHDVNFAGMLPITKISGLYAVGQAVVAPGLIGAMTSAFLLDKMLER